VPLIDPFI
jgi:CubicO group peptidase (beta-lactamase class C family)